MQTTRKLAAILSADVFGYSRLMGDDEGATLAAIIDARRLVGRWVERRGGRVVDATGDSLLAEFASAVEAVLSAREIQRELARKNERLPEHRRLLLRIGLNLGDVIEREGALYGDGVNIAARLQTVGEPGGVCISGSIHDLVVSKLSLRFEPLEERQFKNIAARVRAYHVRDERDTLAEDEAAAHTAAPAPVPPSASDAHNLPLQLSSFIGRDAQIRSIANSLQAQRLVTLVGPGGIGKTRLALQVAAQTIGQFPDGVWLVELAALADPRLVPQALASVLGVKEVAGERLTDTLSRALAHRGLLIVLDNCEHLLQACADLTHQLLQTAAKLKVLVTSREPLRVGGEAVHAVPALATPQPQQTLPLDEACRLEAVELFADRARAVLPAFELTPGNLAAVIDICHRLDGIPLAIELAAARVHVLSVDQIAERLDDRFRLLTRGDRSAMPRQQTLRALIDWSHDLLSQSERVLFRRLAVFAGGWTLEAAEAVAATGELRAPDVLELTAQLVDRSMVESDAASGRYRLLQTIRQYAEEPLEQSGEDISARERHLAYYLSLAERASAGLTGPDQAAWLERLDPEQENFLAAHAWCDRSARGAESGLRLMFWLKLYLFNRGLLAPLRGGLADALARPGAQARDIDRCRALYTAGQVATFMGRFAQAQVQLEEALAIAHEVGDIDRAVLILQTLGMTCVEQDDRTQARAHFEQALRLAQPRADLRALAGALNALAQLDRVEGQYDSAEPLYERSLALTRQLGDRDSTAVGLLNLAMVAIARGAHPRAGDLLREALGIADSIGSKLTGGNVLAVTAGLAAASEDWIQAAALFGAAQAQLQQTGSHLDAADQAFLDPLIERARDALTAESFATAEAAARALNDDAAMAMARRWLHQAAS